MHSPCRHKLERAGRPRPQEGPAGFPAQRKTLKRKLQDQTCKTKGSEPRSIHKTRRARITPGSNVVGCKNLAAAAAAAMFLLLSRFLFFNLHFDWLLFGFLCRTRALCCRASFFFFGFFFCRGHWVGLHRITWSKFFDKQKGCLTPNPQPANGWHFCLLKYFCYLSAERTYSY